jgi:hypothetical protein
LPVPAAGPNQNIPNGAFTDLEGSASGGSGTYSYHWEPADKLIDPDVSNPTTINLFATTLFSLEVTDSETGCVSETVSQVTVNVSGDILAVNPMAAPEDICEGDETQLFALPGGGSGEYEFTWTGPDGFYSSDENPFVSPEETGTYTVVVDDGFNQSTGSVSINVYPSPEVYLGPPDTIVCVYDTVLLDAGGDGTEYLWSNGATERFVKVGTTGIGFDMKTLSVLVTGVNGCDIYETINVMFDFSQCLGIDDNPLFGEIRIFPNPNDGYFTLELSEYSGDLEVLVTDMYGRLILARDFDDIQGTFKTDLQLYDVSHGIYLITLKTETAVTSRKLMIRR